LLKTIFSATPDLLVLKDRDSVYQAVNPAFCGFLGKSESEVVGQTDFELFPPRETDMYRRDDLKVMTTGIRQVQDEEVAGVHGKKWFQVIKTPVVDDKGAVTGILASVRDISERKLAEAALKESEQQLRLLTSQLFHAQEKERHRLSRELHDELGQALTVLKIHLGAIDNKLRKDQQKLKGDCEHLLNHINNIIANVRRLSWDLSPTILEDLGLSSALRHLIDETCANHDMACSIELDEIDPLFSPEAKTHIYRFFQEALNNLSKHSQATFFSLKVTRQDDQVSFTLVDNGRGFEVDQAQSQNVREKRLGLTTMNERARMAGGSLQIWSGPGKGARLTFTLPTDKKGP
jgi:hypothetical protein